MSETQTVAAVGAEINPFDSDHFSHGGGLWDGKTVTITSAVAKAEALKRADGSAVLDEKGQQIVLTGLFVKGIADGGDDKERHEEYSSGDKLAPTPDGEGFVAKDGGAVKFHANSNIGKFAASLKASGFPMATLFDGGRQRLGKLVGARFVFKSEAKVGKDGKSVKDKKGYDKNTHLPVKFVGYAGSVPVAAGAAQTVAGGDALTAKATAAVLAALASGGGKLTRAELVRTLAGQLTGDADANAIIGLVVRDDFHKGKPWTYDGTQASL